MQHLPICPNTLGPKQNLATGWKVADAGPRMTQTVTLAGNAHKRILNMAETLILSVGPDPSTLYAREALLRSEGYIVVSATSIKEAFRMFQDEDFDLMILGEALPQQDRERLTYLIRASGSRIPIVSLATIPWEQGVFPDAIFQEDPAGLAASIRRLLGKQFDLTTVGSSSTRASRLSPIGAPVVSQA